MAETSTHSIRSSHREALIEHLFAGEIMKRLWLAGIARVEVLKPQVDDGGYDLVLEANSIVRHVQLNTRCTQTIKTTAGDCREGINQRRHDASDTGIDKRVAARGCAPVMGARLQSHPGGSSPQINARPTCRQ